jgi:hypothetical protein
MSTLSRWSRTLSTHARRSPRSGENYEFAIHRLTILDSMVEVLPIFGSALSLRRSCKSGSVRLAVTSVSVNPFGVPTVPVVAARAPAPADERLRLNIDHPRGRQKHTARCSPASQSCRKPTLNCAYPRRVGRRASMGCLPARALDREARRGRVHILSSTVARSGWPNTRTYCKNRRHIS